MLLLQWLSLGTRLNEALSLSSTLEFQDIHVQALLMCVLSAPPTHAHSPLAAGVRYRVHDVWVTDAVSQESKENEEDSQ